MIKEIPTKFSVTLGESKNIETDSEPDYMVKSIGAFGVWQAIITLIAASTSFIVAVNVSSIVYLTPTTEYKCVAFEGDEISDVKNSTCYANCTEYEFYDTLFEDSLISRFGLICDNAWLASFTQSILMMGLMLGSSGFGWISDRFGRKIAFRLTAVITSVSMVAAPFAPTFWIFSSIRFFCGLGTGGVMSLAVVVSVEVIGPQYRDLVGSCATIPDGLFTMLMTLIAYSSSTWDTFLLICGLLSVVHLTAICTVPESPRWLISQQEGEKAIELLTKIAIINKLDVKHIQETVNMTLATMKKDQETVNKVSFVDLFRTKSSSLVTTASFFLWFFSGMYFFGICQYITFLGSNIYIVTILSGIIQIISALISMLVNKYVSRKFSVILTSALSGFSIMVLIFVPEGHWTVVLFANIGLTATNAVFCIIFVQANELYPTPLRNIGFGVSSAGSKLGAMIAPFIANTRPQWIASTIFAVMPFAAICFSVLLPETKGKKLRDTVN